MHRVFISYHHANDQFYKERLVEWAEKNDVFKDWSVDIGDIDEDLPDERIREIIRDEYLQTSSVTILLVGTETKHRKHIDWELYSSMYDGKVNKKSGIIVINLPSVSCDDCCTAKHEGEKDIVFPEQDGNWVSISTREDYERLYPYMPARIIDNLLASNVKISVIPWNKLTPTKLKYMIDKAYEDRTSCQYDLRRPMRRNNS